MGKIKVNQKLYLNTGQHWQEWDNRFTRVVKVLEVENSRVKIRTLVNIHNTSGRLLPTGRITWANIERFNGKSGGYYLLTSFCDSCQLERGARVPKGGHGAITVTLGTCSGCLRIGVGLVPNCDYDWPKEGKKAIFD